MANVLTINEVEKCCMCDTPTKRNQLVLMSGDDVFCKACYATQCWHDRGHIVTMPEFSYCDDCGAEV